MNILVTDPNYKHALGIVRNLGAIGVKPYLWADNKFNLCALSKYSLNTVLIEKEDSKEQVIEKLLKNKIELIIIVGTNSFKKIVPWKNDLKENKIDIITVDNEKLNLAFSKKDTYSFADNIGIPIARTFYPESFEDFNIVLEKVTFPCVIKGLYEVGGNIVDYANTKNQLKERYMKLCKENNILEEDGLPMLQEYIPGDGCAFFAIYNSGKCGLTFQHKRIREFPVSGGASTCAQSYKNELVEEYGKLLLDKLEWHGVAMVEFKLNKNGIPILMEINPKFWGSTDLALEAGVNFPQAIIDIHLGKEVEFSNSYKYPFIYQWPLDGDLLHGFVNKKNLLQVLKDLLNPKIKNNIWLKDFKPTIFMVILFFRSIVMELRKK